MYIPPIADLYAGTTLLLRDRFLRSQFANCTQEIVKARLFLYVEQKIVVL
jgi:hypothetical protein